MRSAILDWRDCWPTSRVRPSSKRCERRIRNPAAKKRPSTWGRTAKVGCYAFGLRLASINFVGRADVEIFQIRPGESQAYGCFVLRFGDQPPSRPVPGKILPLQ